MAKLILGDRVNSPQECIEFIHATYQGKKVLSSILDPKKFWSSTREYAEGIDGAMLFSPSTKIVASGTYLVPAVIAAAAYFRGITSLQLSAEINSVVTVKQTINGVRYYCGNNAVLLGQETNGNLEVSKATPVVIEAFIRQLYLTHRSQIAAVA